MHISKSRPIAFIKIIKKEFANSILKEGLLYMRNIQYYRKQEQITSEKYGKFDPYDGCSFTYPANGGTLSVSSATGDKSAKVVGPAVLTSAQHKQSYIYCLHAVFVEHLLNCKDYFFGSLWIPGSCNLN